MPTIFKDRKAVYPNRFKVTPTSGDSYYVYLERADEPTEPGTPLNADTFNAVIEELSQGGSLTEDTVKALIQEELGVIENGTY